MPIESPKPHLSERTEFGEAHGRRPTAMQPRHLLTLQDVADVLGVSKAWVRDHATRRNPRIPVVRFGDKRAVLRFRPEDLETFIAKHMISDEEII